MKGGFEPQGRGRLYSDIGMFGVIGDVHSLCRLRHRNPPEAFRSGTEQSLQPDALQERQEPFPDAWEQLLFVSLAKPYPTSLPRAPPRHRRDARVYGHTTTAMHDNEYTPPARVRPYFVCT